LINDAGHAFLADFGLSRILEELSGSASTTSNLAGSIRWMAPELIISSLRPTVLSDMYAFGSLMLEVSEDILY
jgi:serine/threonine protein kinase